MVPVGLANPFRVFFELAGVEGAGEEILEERCECGMPIGFRFFMERAQDQAADVLVAGEAGSCRL